MKNKGFSLIELMIVVAIIGILSLISLPFYRDYVIRVRIAEAIYEASFIKDELLEIFFTEGQGSQAMNDYLYPEGYLTAIQINGKSAQTARLTNNVNIGSGTGWNYVAFGMNIQLQDGILPKEYDRYSNNITMMIYVGNYSYIDTEGNLHTIKQYTATEAGDIDLKTFCGQAKSPSDLTKLKQTALPRRWLPHGCRDGAVQDFPTNIIIQDGAVNF